MEFFIVLLCILLSSMTNFFIEIIYKLIIINKNIDAYQSIGELERDINVNYSPAIVSLLYDNRIEPRKDIIAVILNLSLKGYIFLYMDKHTNTYKIKRNMNTISFSNMSPEEKYVYDWLFFYKKFDFIEWVNIIKRNYNEIIPKKSCNIKRKNIILISIMILFEILYLINIMILNMFYSDNTNVLLIGILLLPVLMISIILTVNKVLTNSFFINLNNKEFIKWSNFKRFMQNYTLIKDKDIEFISIYEKYLPYSIALNVNKKYKTIWKNIIPKKRRFQIIFQYVLHENILLKPLFKIIKDDELNTYYN